jgi:hypothetical protein
LTVIIEPGFGFAVETVSDWPRDPLMVFGEVVEAFAGVIEIVNAVNTKSESNFLMWKILWLKRLWLIRQETKKCRAYI